MKTRMSIAVAIACVCFGTTLSTQQPRHAQEPSSEHLPHMGHRFDDPERFARTFDDPTRDEWQMPARVIDALNVQPGQLVADIGAGTGYFTVRLAGSTAAATVYAVDIEPSMVDYVRQRADADGLENIVGVLAERDQTNLPESVDLVLIVNTYHHLPDREAYFTALKRRMKPSARLAIIDFRKDAPSGPPVEFRFTPDQISRELGEAGFTLLEMYEFLPRQIFLVYGAS